MKCKELFDEDFFAISVSHCHQLYHIKKKIKNESHMKFIGRIKAINKLDNFFHGMQI